MCLNVPFLSLTPLHSFPLRQFSGRQRIDLILGLSYHLAAFHSSVFIKIRRAETRERKRGREKRENWHKIHNVLNEDSERRGECAEYTEGKCKTDVGPVRVVGERRALNISYACMQSKAGIAGQTEGR